jgi:hypothetical protein
VHQVYPKDLGSQNFSFLGFKEEASAVNFAYGNGAARDSRTKFTAQTMLFIHKMSKKLFKKISFLDTKPILSSYSICGK